MICWLLTRIRQSWIEIQLTGSIKVQFGVLIIFYLARPFEDRIKIELYRKNCSGLVYATDNFSKRKNVDFPENLLQDFHAHDLIIFIVFKSYCI